MSLGGDYVFATVMCLVLSMCILISCSSVLCVLMVGMFMFVKVMSSLINVISPSLFVLSVCAYGPGCPAILLFLLFFVSSYFS